MNADTRRAIHAALDHVLDAIAEGEKQRPKRRRVRPVPPAPDPETEQHVRAVLERAGFQ